MDDTEVQTPQDNLVNVVDPDTNELHSLPIGQLAQAKQQGFTEATQDDVNAYQRHEKYGGLAQGALAGLEGAASAASFGLSTGLERASGLTTPEDIRGRREEHPGAQALGQVAGLAASTLIPGYGEGAIGRAGAAGALELGGKAAVEALGLGAAEGLAAKVGSKAVQLATENMLFQAGDEVSKMFSQNYANPSEAIESAATNIGLAGVIGGGLGATLGAVSPLWQATMGGKTTGLLKAIQDRVGGVEGGESGIVSKTINDAIDKSGLDVSPEIKATLSDNPGVWQWAKTLEQSDTTKSGLKYQEAMQNFKSSARDTIAQSLGKSPEDLENLKNLDKHDLGKSARDTMISEFRQVTDPAKEQWNQISNKFKEAPLTDADKGMLAEKLANIDQEMGLSKNPDGPQNTWLQKKINTIKLQDNAEDVRKLISNINDETFGFDNPLRQVGKKVVSALSEAQDGAISKAFELEHPLELGKLAEAKQGWRDIKGLIEDLSDRLHPGRSGGPEGFIKNVEDMAKPELILRRLSDTQDKGLQQLLETRFPKTAALVKDFQLNDLLKKSVKDGEINPTSLFKNIDKLPPNIRESLIPADAQGKLDAVKTLLNQINDRPHNYSNTARVADKLLGQLPGSAVAMATMAMGGNPAMGFVLGGLTKYLAKDAPDAIRLGLLKFLGSSAPIEATGFKAMVDYVAHSAKGAQLLSRGAKAIFKAGEDVLPSHLIPNQKGRDKLDKKLLELQNDPTPLFDVGGKAGHYISGQGAAIGKFAANGVQYLNSIRPATQKPSPLDKDIEPTTAQKNDYSRALDIAQQPLVVLPDIKKGLITPKDVAHLQHIYPALYNKINQKLTDQMIDASSKDIHIPYTTRMGISTFMAKPLDSTMTPQGIMAAQPHMQPQPPPQQMPQGRQKHSMNQLSKLPNQYQTTQEARISQRNKNG